MIKFNKKNHKILTPVGYKNFVGIQKLKKECVSLETEVGSLSCSKNHPICISFEDDKFEKISDLKIGDSIYTIEGYKKILNIEPIGRKDVYDILEVEGVNCYFSNGILSHNCQFLDDGSAAIDAELIDILKKDCCEPKELLDEGHYKIWEDPDSSRVYVAGVDVSEGVGQDACVIQVLDITDLKNIKQVAEYHNNMIAPAEFSNKLYEILQHWGSPLVLIERNNQGGQVCDRLAIDFGYNKVVSWGTKKARRMNEQIGVISHTNTKYAAILNERYFINEVRSVTFRSIHTLNEFKTFVRYPNGSWKAKSGEHDDRVMAMVWALMILFNEITEEYFDIVELDDYGKPLVIEPRDIGVSYFENPTSIYTNEVVDRIENSNLAPMCFGSMSEAEDEMAALAGDGWVLLGGSMPYFDPDRNISKEHMEAIDRYFG